MSRAEVSWAQLAGPALLGRSLLIGRGAAVAAPWVGRQRIVLDPATLVDPATLAALRRAYLTRTPVIVELDPTVTEIPSGVDERDVWRVAPNADLVAEATWRLATWNSVDARDPARPRWRLAEAAVAAGATTSTHPGADVVRADGTPLWCDGGPLQLWGAADVAAAGAAIVPRVALRAGRLDELRAPASPTGLAPDQLAAVLDPAGRARIIAPAGSGKTRVLTERARYVLGAGVPVGAVLLVAFNRRAREEMRGRTADLPGLQIQTLNAVALSILNGTDGFAPRGTRLSTIDERAAREVIASLVKLPRRANTDPFAAWLDALGEVRLGLRSPEAVERSYGGDVEGFAEFFPAYRRVLAERGLVDFDEQIYLALEVLLRDAGVRRAAERRAEVLLVDEFQDLNPAHMLLLRLLAGPALSIFAVGDDDQTIYGFSGATPEWLVRFADHVPEAAHHALEVNYRCPSSVVEAAANLLSHNRVRVDKQIRPGPANVRDPSAMTLVRVADPVADTLAHVRGLLDAGAQPAQVAVLARVNALLAPVQAVLLEVGVPVNLAESANFLRSASVASALAWLRAAVRPEDLRGADITLAASRPGRALSPRVREWMGEQRTLDGLERLAGRLDEASSIKVLGFVEDLRRAAAFAAGASTAQLVEFIETSLGLDAALATLDASHRGRNTSSTSDGMRSLRALGRAHPDVATFDRWLSETLGARAHPDGVVLATVHKVKGLEWPHVVLFDASESIFPHRLSTDVEEERRVFHVGLTRCVQSLRVVADATAPSMFLAELAAPARATKLSSRPPTNDTPAATPARDLEVHPGAAFSWGGYDCVVEETSSAGALVVAGDRRTTIAWGSLVLVDGRERRLRAARTRRAAPANAAPTAPDSPLFATLRAWRLEQARADQVPAYVVCTDRTLGELVRARPRTLRELLEVPGIGPAKADRYGDQILALLAESPDH